MRVLGPALCVFAPANPLFPFSALSCGHRQQPHGFKSTYVLREGPGRVSKIPSGTNGA